MVKMSEYHLESQTCTYVCVHAHTDTQIHTYTLVRSWEEEVERKTTSSQGQLGFWLLKEFLSGVLSFAASEDCAD